MAYWLAIHGTALAQQGMPNKDENGGGQYVMSYFLVIMGVAVGLLVVCRASNRRDRANPRAMTKRELTSRTSRPRGVPHRGQTTARTPRT